MAEYLPPTENLPKFNEFVFDDAYSIEGLDRRVVHKAGTETITGQKTFTNDVFLVENSAGADKISVNGTTTTIINTNINLQAVAGTNVLSITSGQVSSNQNISISKTLSTSTAPTLSISNGQFNSQSPLVALRYFSGAFSGYGAKLFPSSLQKASYNVFGTETLTDMLNWDSSTGDVSLSANSGSSNVISLIGDAIDAVSFFYSSRYFLGRSTGTNIRLASMTLPLGTCLIPTGAAGTQTSTGNWSPTGTSAQIRTPEWGNFYPIYAMIGFDNGTLTFGAGASLTIAVRIREETNNYDYTTTGFSVISTTLNAPSGGAGDFTTFSAGSNSRISGGVLIRFQIVSVRSGGSITASSKSCYATVYGYQST